MSDTIDERTAWNLVRAVPPGLAGKASPTRVHHDPNLDVWLQVEPSGQWASSGDVTDAARDLFDLYLPLQLSNLCIFLGNELRLRSSTSAGGFQGGLDP